MQRICWFLLLCVVTCSVALPRTKAPFGLWPSLITTAPRCPSVPPLQDLKDNLQELAKEKFRHYDLGLLSKLGEENLEKHEDAIVELSAENAEEVNGTVIEESIDEDNSKTTDEPSPKGKPEFVPTFIPIFRPRAVPKPEEIKSPDSKQNPKDSKNLVVTVVKNGNTNRDFKVTVEKNNSRNALNVKEDPKNIVILNSVPPNAVPFDDFPININPLNDLPFNTLSQSSGGQVDTNNAKHFFNTPPFNREIFYILKPGPANSVTAGVSMNSDAGASNSNTIPGNNYPSNIIPSSVNTISSSSVSSNRNPSFVMPSDKLASNDYAINSLPPCSGSSNFCPKNILPYKCNTNIHPSSSIRSNSIHTDLIPFNNFPNTLPSNTVPSCDCISTIPSNTVPSNNNCAFNALSSSSSTVSTVPSNNGPLCSVPSYTVPPNSLNTVPSNNCPISSVPSNTVPPNSLNTVPPNNCLLNTGCSNSLSLNRNVVCKDAKSNLCADKNEKGNLVLFKPETVSVMNIEGDVLKKTTLTVLVPTFMSKLSL